MLYAGEPYERDGVRIGAPDPAAIRRAAIDPDVAGSVEKWLSRAETDTDVQYFAVFEGGQLVGQIFLHDIDRVKGEALVGYHLFERRHRGRGIGTAMLSLLQRYVREETALRELVAITDESNAASKRVALKCGFAYAGRPREDPENGVVFAWCVSAVGTRTKTRPARLWSPPTGSSAPYRWRV